MRLALLGTILAASLFGQTDHKPVSDPKPEDAARAIFSAFDTYEIVGLNAAHGRKDEDDFILSLIRRPGFPATVNDIVVECGNSLYQPLLDRYIDGADVPFSEARVVWRNTTQNMCSTSEFYEELFPLVRAINLSVPAPKRLRVLCRGLADRLECSQGSGGCGASGTVPLRARRQCRFRHRKASVRQTPKGAHALWHWTPVPRDSR